MDLKRFKALFLTFQIHVTQRVLTGDSFMRITLLRS